MVHQYRKYLNHHIIFAIQKCNSGWTLLCIIYKILFEAILCPCESQFSSGFLDLKLECLWQPNKITIFLEIHIRWMYPYKKPSWLFYFSPIWILKDPNGGKKWDIFIWHFFPKNKQCHWIDRVRLHLKYVTTQIWNSLLLFQNFHYQIYFNKESNVWNIWTNKYRIFPSKDSLFSDWNKVI